MAILVVSPTRMELIRIRKRLLSAVKGHKLLTDKRDELMRQFLEVVQQAKRLRQCVEKKLAEINSGFALAAAVMRKETLASALMLPRQSIALEVVSKSIMGVSVPIFEAHQKTQRKEDALSYGYAFTSGELDHSIMTLSELLPELLQLARSEKTAQLLAAEIERTRRRVNALEYVMIPNYRETIRYITMKLEENERGNLSRLMKVKDMMVQKQTEDRRRRFEANTFD